ncbi:MAG: hypothetical protein NTW21_13025 [Verrucomicrobia bacterium]|nr:hypothetical protein [Verrucomicrobiota bacterium]
MVPSTLLLRQVTPSFIQAGRVTSQVFHPTPKDKDLLSAYDGDLIGAEAAWVHYTQQLGLRSAGVLALAVAECAAEGLSCRPDPQRFPEHAVIDFTGKTKRDKKAIASILRDRAVARDWLFEAALA